MSIIGLDHVQLAMPFSGETVARKFYAEILGLTEVPKPENLAKRGGCWFERGAVRIHLGVDKDFKAATKAHPAFLVDDLQMFIAKLSRYNITIINDQPLEGYHRAYIHDPFGNRLELMQRR